MAATFREPLAVFTSYAHTDEDLRAELHKHLTPLIRQRRIVEWHDRRIAAGADWRSQIEARLETAHVVMLLVSPDFLHSEYCHDVELKRALERERTNDSRIVPVLLREVYWKEEPFARFQVLPRNGQAVCSAHWSSRDAAFVDVVQGVRTLVAELVGEELPESTEPGETLEIELPVELEQFTGEYRDRFLDALVSTLKLTGRVRLVAVRRGSAILTLEVDPADVELVVRGLRAGALDSHGFARAKVLERPALHAQGLLAAARRGESGALERLFERYYERVHRMVGIRMGATLRRHVDVMDVVQDTFMTVFNRVEQFEGRDESSFIQWLSVLVQNRIMDATDRLRAAKRDPARELPMHDSDWMDLVDDDEGPLVRAARDEERELLDRCIAELPREQRELILLRDFAGASWESIAEQLARPNTDVLVESYRRARMSLARQLRSRSEETRRRDRESE